MKQDLPIESVLDTMDYGDKIKCISGLVATLDQMKSNQVHKTYLIKKITELRLVSKIINDLLCQEELIHSPKRQQSKIKKSRIIFDQQVDLMLLKGSIAKLEQSIKDGFKLHQEIHPKFQQIQSQNLENKDDDQFEHLDIMRVVQIYQSEMEYVNEYFNRIENNPNNANSHSLDILNQSYQEMLLDDNIIIITQYFKNLNQLIENLENLKQKLIQYEEFESQSTNFENSRNSSTNEKHFGRNKSQTYELCEQQRINVLKEITNEIKEKSSETCINCSIF
ncbi:unnamed protein product (macronuclear) [Paramecium tetraurelia]|uniref:Uncharacterized protein n=1 Tax=Paramecium tetraurelia TaxID=5888 RepID=A0C650_PARTE|nr:uncharacterized protein GSPATT00035396001 [Paramecium tetraurelia]CAK66267.1 unnamed protein product [Paramecium tetraurelia]|eukprot:XP_001433664.1 hypothetical protein (macronuclear) [Paramecium tetraurelia strain d4-2]